MTPTYDHCVRRGWEEIRASASVVERGDPAAPVPACPGWSVRDLVDHLGGIHRWVAAMVTTLAPQRLAREEMDFGTPSTAADLAAWLLEGGEELLVAFRRADPDASMWSWGGDQAVRFWPRRMLHETAVHRTDLAEATGQSASIDTATAADGIDEWLTNMPFAARYSPALGKIRGDGQRLGFEALDADRWWVATLHPDGFGVEAPNSAPDDLAAVVAGPAFDLLRVLTGRAALGGAVSSSGDRALVAHWLDHSVF